MQCSRQYESATDAESWTHIPGHWLCSAEASLALKNLRQWLHGVAHLSEGHRAHSFMNHILSVSLSSNPNDFPVVFSIAPVINAF